MNTIRMDAEKHPETLKQKKNNYKKEYLKNGYNFYHFKFKKNKLIFFYFNIKYSETEEQEWP